MEAVFLKILNMSITAGWIVLAVLIARFLLKKAPRWISVLLWSIVGIRLVCPFSFESIFSLIPSAKTVPSDIIYTETPMIQSGVPILNSVINPTLSENFAPEVGASVNPMQIVTLVATVLWLVGIVAMLAYLLISYFKISRRVNEAVLLKDNVYICDKVASPFILGVFRPKIYLPSNMNEVDREYVLAHERAHLKRCDHLWKPLGFLMLSVYWFNPLLWLAYVLLCRDIEFACDEKVIKQMGVEIKKHYSDTLINCSVPRRYVTACPLAFGEVGIKGRIKSVLSYKKPTLWIIIAAIITSAVLTVCFLTDPKSKDDETDSTYITESDHIPDTIGDIDYSFDLTSIFCYDDPRDKFIEAGATPTRTSDGVQSLPVIKITSTEQLEFFKQTMNGTIDFKASYNDAIPAFDDISYKYNDAYFEKNNLLLVYACAPHTSQRFSVEYVEKNSLMLTVAISKLNIAIAADDAVCYYLVAVNVDKNKTIDVENVEAFISSEIYPGEEITAKNVIKKYVSLESDDMLPSAVSLFDNGRFIFTFPSYSGYMEYGTYEEKDDVLILTAEDGKIYSFNTNTDFISFDAESSAKEPLTSLINNGAIYTEMTIGNIPFTFEPAVFFPRNGGVEKLEEVGLFRTKVLSDKSFGYSTIKISTKAEFDNFMNVVGEVFDGGDNFLKPDYVPTFGDHSKKYSDEYFKNNTLLLIYGVTDLASVLSVDCVYSFSSKMSITMTEFSPSFGLACPVYWLIGVNISKNYNLDYVKDIQTISNVCIFPKDVNNLTNATNRYFLPASEGNTAYTVVLLSNERFILGKNQYNFLFGKYEKNSKRLKLTVEEGKVYYFDIGDGYIEFDAKASYDTLGLIDRSRFVSDYKPVKSQFKYSVIPLNGYMSYEKFKEAGTTVSNVSNTAKSLPVIKIKSKAELDAFKEKTKDAIDYSNSKSQYYTTFDYEMNNINFNKYDALLVFVIAPDLSTRYTVDYVKNGYGKYEIGITEISPPAALTAGASWLVVVKIEKDESLASCNALISSKVYPDGLYDTDNKKAVGRYVHPLYVENEETPCAVTLFDDGRFTFTFGAESDFTSYGFYEESNVRLKLKGEEGDVYYFDLKDGQIIFDADASSSGHSVVKRVDDATAFVKMEPPSKSYYV